MTKWKCENYEPDNALVHEGQCDCNSGCGGQLCFTCCEEDMFGGDE